MRRRCENLIVLIVAVAVGCVAGPANARLHASWRLDDDSGTIAHESARGKDGQLLGGLSFDDNAVPGLFGNALELDGVDDGIFVSKEYTLPTDAPTISLWFQPKETLKHDSEQMVLWSTLLTKAGGRPSLVFNRSGDGRIHFRAVTTGDPGGVMDQLSTTTDSWTASTWHHIAVTFDGTDFKIFVNGILENTVRHPSVLYGTRRYYIGVDSKGERAFAGKLDDIRVYSSALTDEEIFVLSRPEPALQSLTEALGQAKSMLKEQRAREAVAFVEKKISEAKEWRQENPDKIPRAYKVLIFDQHFLLARAKNAAGLPDNEVEAACQKAFEDGRHLTLSDLSAAVRWAQDNVGAESYQRLVQTLIQHNQDFFRAVAHEAERSILAERAETALRLVQASLAGYSGWQSKHPSESSPAERGLPDVYLYAGKAKEALGAPADDIAFAYSRAFSPLDLGYTQERFSALIWMLEHGSTSEYVKAVRSFGCGPAIARSHKGIVSKTCDYFESKKEWPQFELFLDTLFTASKLPGEWAMVAEQCLNKKTNRWRKRYFEYLDSRPRLRFARDYVLAERYMAEEEFQKAAELYEDILNRCGPEDDRGRLEFQLSKSLLKASGYRQAGPKLGDFIVNHRATHSSLVKEAMLMKCRALVEIDEPDKAVNSLNALMKEYPEAKKIPDVNFLLGYCHMSLNKLEAAKESFQMVLRDHPGSPYASRARLCMVHIERMLDAA